MNPIGGVNGSSGIMQYVMRNEKQIKQGVLEISGKMEQAKARGGQVIRAMLNASVTNNGTGSNLNILA